MRTLFSPALRPLWLGVLLTSAAVAAQARGNWSVDYLKQQLPNANVELVERLRGLADAAELATVLGDDDHYGQVRVDHDHSSHERRGALHRVGVDGRPAG